MTVMALPLESVATHRIEWLTVDHCPVCASAHRVSSLLPESGYVFGNERIEFPAGGVGLATCANCSLIYKTVIPEAHSLSQVFERQAGNKWMEPYDFREEIAELQRLAGRRCDLLDIGSGNGQLLKGWASWSHSGRRSALDVIRHPGETDHVNGEFISGLVDSEPLQWSGRPYHLVTLFDVVEHLYAPTIAFKNLRDLVRANGLVVIETGNVASHWPKRYGAHHWWYVRLFEHHVFWSRRSIEYIAERFGFRLLLWRDVRHKAHGSLPLIRRLNDCAQVAMYRLTPQLYTKFGPLVGKHWTQPWSPFACDHFRVVLRRQ